MPRAFYSLPISGIAMHTCMTNQPLTVQAMCATYVSAHIQCITVCFLQEFWYYLNDGLYGSYMGHSVNGYIPSKPSLLKVWYGMWSSLPVQSNDNPLVQSSPCFCSQEGNGPHYRSKLFGPTCCPHDIITDAVLPELNGGDWLYFKGIYYTCTFTCLLYRI